MMVDETQWACPTCRVRVGAPFCAQCGEVPIAPRGLTLRGVAEKALHAITGIDARTARSAETLLRRPADLTLAWTEGIRKPFVAPCQLFLIANVIFFTLHRLTSESVFSASLDSHLQHQD